MNKTPATFAALCIGLAVAAPAAAQDMPAPAYTAGDHWTFRETDLLTRQQTAEIRETVVSADATAYWIESRRAAHTWLRGDAARMVNVEQKAWDPAAADQRGKTIGSNDAGCAYPWPLKVGMRFECVERVLFPSGQQVRYELKWTVEAAETVEVPAGRFPALRLVADGFSTDLVTGNVGRHQRTVWLSAAARREVKHEIRTLQRDGKPYRVEGRELLSFKPGAS
jgi:hypothetical protein